MTATRGLSTSNIAIIAAACTFGLIALMVIIAYLCDLLKRMRQKNVGKKPGKPTFDMDDVDVEKEVLAVTIKEVNTRSVK